MTVLGGGISGGVVGAGQFVTEVGVFKPAVEGAFSDAGGAGGLGQGGSGGDDRERSLLAVGEAGKFYSPVDFSQFLPLRRDGGRGCGLGAAFGHNMSRASVAGLDLVRRNGLDLTCVYDMGWLPGWARGEMTVVWGVGQPQGLPLRPAQDRPLLSVRPEGNRRGNGRAALAQDRLWKNGRAAWAPVISDPTCHSEEPATRNLKVPGPNHG